MYQPDGLKTDEYLPWSRGRGNDVWGMIRAAADGDVAALDALVSREATLVDCEYQYYRPLHFAVRENRLDAVRYLLEHGADPMCGGLGFEPAFRPKNPGNLPWAGTMAHDRGFTEVAELMDRTLWERFQFAPEGEILADLIRRRDLAGVVAALDARPELLNIADGFGTKPIHWAVMTRNLKMIDELLARGADINATRPDGDRPIDLTNGDYHYRGWRDVPAEALREHVALIGYLIARGAYYDISTAAQLGDLERVRELADENPALVNALPDSTGYYNGVPLRCAAKDGHLDVVTFLLERGADPNRPEPVAPFGGALYDAIAGKHWKIVKLLLQHGANPNAHLESSGTVFWRAKRDGAPGEIINLLAAHGASSDPQMAGYDCDLEVLATMFNANPNIEIQDYLDTDNEEVVGLAMRFQPNVLKGKYFAGSKSVERARWLLQQGMDAVNPSWQGVTPLHRFALAGKQDMAALCLEYGADLNALDDEFHSTPLGWAARAGCKEMVEWLLAQGANPTLPNNIDWATPLAWATRRGHSEIVTLLQSVQSVP